MGIPNISLKCNVWLIVTAFGYIRIISWVKTLNDPSTFNLSMGLGHGLAPGKTHFIQGDPGNLFRFLFVFGLDSDVKFVVVVHQCTII